MTKLVYPVVAETGMRRNERTIPFRSGLDGHLIRGAMVFTFFAFSIQNTELSEKEVGP